MSRYADEYLKKALEFIYERLEQPATSIEEVFSVLSGQAIVVPNPGYGNIVYEQDRDYFFPTMKALFDDRKEALAQFFADRLAPYFFHANLDSIPATKQNENQFFWENGFFPEGDAHPVCAVGQPQPRATR